MYLGTYCLFVSVLDFKISASIPKCKTLTLIKIQKVQEFIESISRAKIQVMMLGFKLLALPMTFCLTLNKDLSLNVPISKVIIFPLILYHKNSRRIS